MYDRVGKALEAAGLSNYLYRFRENEIDDELVEFCLYEPSMVDELNRIMPVKIHQLKFKLEFRKTGKSQKDESFQYSQFAPNFEQFSLLDTRQIASGSSPPNQNGGITLREPLKRKSSLPSLRSELQKIFSDMDKDKSGRLSVEELYEATKKSEDSKLTLDACRLMISMFNDKNAKGSIDILGFFNLVLQGHEWTSIFEKFDHDKSGYLDKRELIGPLQEMAKGYIFDQDFVDMIINKFGKNGRLDIHGYINTCAFISNFTRGFREKDWRREGVINYQDFMTLVLNAWN